ncbi:hypothetical protein FHR24_001044 [Wenyingzhuangia heitensis]|uniref:Uncharacterized protein n=1 Tax=Wenyingzhuangia heitensis TaxID=1487859 RepID=A0ABX0U9X7_9FLAO|nr:hypothetical protein [Wenyingzhuangia heitensis]NIJ44605.1 hypothetical protein [Wenyingzhuangia heitensis]
MSYLNSYRINFWGGISTNVCTANNDDVNQFMVDPVKAMLSPLLSNLTDEQAVQNLKANPGWNYYGDYVTKFNNAKISSFGTPNNIQETGNIIDQGIYLLGSLDPANQSKTPVGSPIMVDVDATGTSCTQILVGGLQIGGNENPILRIHENTKCYTRSLQTINTATQEGNFQAKSINIQPPGFGIANTCWQLSFEYNQDWEYDTSNPQITALVEEAKKAKGITVVFTMFEVMTIYSRQAIISEYEQGNAPINPVLGYTIGSIGIWNDDEAATCLPGRILKSDASNNSNICSADTYVQLTDKVLSLNMASTFIKPKPRAKRDDLSTMSPTADPGNLYLAVKNSGKTSVICKIPYNHTTYYTSGGLVDIVLNDTQIEQFHQGDLLLVALNTDNSITATYACEQTYRIISDDRGIYINPNETKNLNFNITKQGQQVTEDLHVDIVFSDSGQLAAAFNQYTEMNVGFSDKSGNPINFTLLDANTNTYKGSTIIKASEAKAFQLNTNWIQAGLKQVSLTINGAESANYYMVVRTYPNDDYSTLPETQKFTWDFVYSEVLRYYYIVFPAMSMRLPLNNEVLISQQVYQVIKQRVSKPYENTTLLMPITRDMSPGKVKLLTDYFDYIHTPKS